MISIWASNYLGYLIPAHSPARCSMGTVQMPGCAGTGGAELEGDAVHLLIEFVDGGYEFVAAIVFGPALGRIQQRELLAVGVDEVEQHDAGFVDDDAGRVLGQVRPVAVGLEKDVNSARQAVLRTQLLGTALNELMNGLVDLLAAIGQEPERARGHDALAGFAGVVHLDAGDTFQFQAGALQSHRVSSVIQKSPSGGAADFLDCFWMPRSVSSCETRTVPWVGKVRLCSRMAVSISSLTRLG